jgi:hypothetical protein
MKAAGLKGGRDQHVKFSVRFVATVRRKNSKTGYVLCLLMVAARLRADVCYSGRAWAVYLRSGLTPICCALPAAANMGPRQSRRGIHDRRLCCLWL